MIPIKNLAEAVAEIVRRTFPSLFYRGIFRCRVVEASEGKITVSPVSTSFFRPPELIEVWGGIGGYAVIPKDDTVLLVAFADADPAFPVVVGFEPLSRNRPRRSQIDAEELWLGDANDGSQKAVHRVGDRGNPGTWTVLGGTSLIYTSPFGPSDGQWSLTGSTPSGPVTFVLVPSTGTPGAMAAKATTGATRTLS